MAVHKKEADNSASQRVETFSTRWQTSKKVGIFSVLTFVGVLGTTECKNGKNK